MAVETFDVGVIGLGGLGSAAAWHLSRRGLSVVGFEQFDLGHHRGASHDHSRIIRRSYHTEHYARLAAYAYETWHEVEAESGESIVARVGGVDVFPPGAAIDHATYETAMARAAVPYEILDGAEVRRRWPAFTLDDDVLAIYQADTGIVPADRGTAILQRLALREGARLRERTPVRSLRARAGGSFGVETDAGTVGVGSVVITADAWANRLLAPLGCPLPLTVLREQLTYFAADGASLATFAPGRFPVWIWMDDPSFYGFPVYGRTDAVKAAEDCGGHEVDPDTRTFDPDPDALGRLARFMEGLVGPGLRPATTTTCLYTLTADRDFVLDRVPGHPHAFVALGAAHGFKFAAWFGRTIADLVTAQRRPGSSPDELAPFAFERPGLAAAASGRRGWLV